MSSAQKHTSRSSKAHSRDVTRSRTRRVRQGTAFKLVLPKGALLHKQKYQQHFTLRDQFEWFAEVPNYGTSYGEFSDTYQLTKKLTLFDLGKGRAWLMTQIFGVTDNRDLCDEQYAGSAANLKFHQGIEAFLNRRKFHGTIVRESQDSLDCGPSEVVLTPRTVKAISRYAVKLV